MLTFRTDQLTIEAQNVQLGEINMLKHEKPQLTRVHTVTGLSIFIKKYNGCSHVLYLKTKYRISTLFFLAYGKW